MGESDPDRAIRPWFPFFAGDWLASTDVMGMTLAQEGAYLRLLCVQWREGFIPDSPKALKSLCKYPKGTKWESLWSHVGTKFVRCEDGKLRNVRLAQLREAAMVKCEKARASIAHRWGKNGIRSYNEGNALETRVDEMKMKKTP